MSKSNDNFPLCFALPCLARHLKVGTSECIWLPAYNRHISAHSAYNRQLSAHFGAERENKRRSSDQTSYLMGILHTLQLGPNHPSFLINLEKQILESRLKPKLQDLSFNQRKVNFSEVFIISHCAITSISMSSWPVEAVTITMSSLAARRGSNIRSGLGESSWKISTKECSSTSTHVLCLSQFEILNHIRIRYFE